MECEDEEEGEMRKGIGENPGRKRGKSGGAGVKKLVFGGEKKSGEKG